MTRSGLEAVAGVCRECVVDEVLLCAAAKVAEWPSPGLEEIDGLAASPDVAAPGADAAAPGAGVAADDAADVGGGVTDADGAGDTAVDVAASVAVLLLASLLVAVSPFAPLVVAGAVGLVWVEAAVTG